MSEIDKKFDNAEKIVDRFGKLALKVVGTIVGIVIACYAGYNQFKGDAEPVGAPTEQIEAIPESTSEHKEEYVITKKTFIVDDYKYRQGDTVYVDYYDDGFIDKYYAKDGKTYYEDE